MWGITLVPGRTITTNKHGEIWSSCGWQGGT